MSDLSELLKVKSWRIWLKALLSATISGVATGFVSTLSTATPSFKNFFLSGLTAGALGAFLYIKKSPMPEWEEKK